MLRYPDFNLPYPIFTYASDYGVGAVHMQEGRPIWYASRSLNEQEVKYDTRDKEAIAIMFGLEKFRPYFYPGHVTVMTDHSNLRWLMAHQQKGRLARWQFMLQAFDFTINYVKGENNPVADVLSRDAVKQPKVLQVNAMGGFNLRKRKISVKNDTAESISKDSLEPMNIDIGYKTDLPYSGVLSNQRTHS